LNQVIAKRITTTIIIPCYSHSYAPLSKLLYNLLTWFSLNHSFIIRKYLHINQWK
jgi:hypothetical protein